MQQKTQDIVKLTVAALSATMLFLATIGISFEWFTLESIEAFGVMLGAFLAFGTTLYGIWMNTYTTRKAFDKAHEKEVKRKIEEGETVEVPSDVPGVVEVKAPEDVEDGSDLK